MSHQFSSSRSPSPSHLFRTLCGQVLCSSPPPLAPSSLLVLAVRKQHNQGSAQKERVIWLVEGWVCHDTEVWQQAADLTRNWELHSETWRQEAERANWADMWVLKPQSLPQWHTSSSTPYLLNLPKQCYQRGTLVFKYLGLLGGGRNLVQTTLVKFKKRIIKFWNYINMRENCSL